MTGAESDALVSPQTFLATGDARPPAARLGVAVVRDLVSAIVTGEVAAGSFLPPEGDLCTHFGVSRTVIRESVKRIEEKGLVRVEHGRGTTVQPSTSWNILDPVVLSALADNDDSLGFLDQLAVVRTALEGSMSAQAATLRTDAQLAELTTALERMRTSLHDRDAFQQADADFHGLVMTMSGNLLAASMTKILFDRARESARFTGNATEAAFALSLSEHQGVLEAIAAGHPADAEARMRSHIIDAWERRRGYAAPRLP
ncbi:MAG TPA: FadR/GntR family transcriptional regulator [Pseudolysinimonas sp.]|nr:FadR/GntR family transcriptional regulator [Pseudolysinimonas sp.]